MLPSPISVSPHAARRFLRRATWIDSPAPDVGAALSRLGYVQIDPINVCGRMHDLILRNRVQDYQEGSLHRYIHQDHRPGFEQFLPVAGILVAFPIEAWPYLLNTMQERAATREGRYLGALTPEEVPVAKRVLDEIRDRGPLMSDEIEHSERSDTAWGSSGRLVKNVLDRLFAHGRVLITERRGFRRVFDLTERVLPASVLSTKAPSPEEDRRWLAHTLLRQRRLMKVSKADLPLVEDLVQPVRIEGCPMLYCLREDATELHEAAGSATPSGASPLLLAPLDPLIYDRDVTRALWGFDYTWEVYTPAHKRVRGYYALPVLAGEELVGHVDLKAERAEKRLVTVGRSIKRGHAVADAVRNHARFLGLKR